MVARGTDIPVSMAQQRSVSTKDYRILSIINS